MLSDILGKLVYPALEKSQACEKPAGPSAFFGTTVDSHGPLNML